MKFLRIPLFIASLLLLQACATSVPLQRAQTSALTQNAPMAEVEKLLANSTMTLLHNFDSNGKSFTAKHYNLQTGSKDQMIMVCAPNCFPIMTIVPVLDSYAVVFDAKLRELFAWGTLEEMSRSPNEAVSAIMPDLKKSHEIAFKAKKD